MLGVAGPSLSAALTVVVVLGPQAFEQRNGLGERLHTLPWPVGHIHRSFPTAAQGRDIRALRYEVQNKLVVASRRRVMDSLVPILVPGIHVGSKLHKVRHRGQPTLRGMRV